MLPFRRLCINRNILECKGALDVDLIILVVGRINRNILECKG